MKLLGEPDRLTDCLGPCPGTSNRVIWTTLLFHELFRLS
jgi:hypothetical protein